MRELEIHVVDGHIIVNLPLTRLTMTYKKCASDLVEDYLWTRDDGSNDFRVRAWLAASQKAREIGWID